MLAAVDALITMVVRDLPGTYRKLNWNITQSEWIETVLPHIEARARTDKLLLQTLVIFPDVSAVFIKNVDTSSYRAELKGYYLYLTQGISEGAIMPPTYKSQHLANELARNLSIVYGIDLKLELTINRSSSRREFGLVVRQ